MKQKRIAAYRFDNAAELQKDLDTLLDNARMLASAKHPDAIINREGPMLLELWEERLSDGSLAYNLGFAVMTAEQIKRDAE